ncbi:hypothetical protein EMPS_08345 [Entomortierella parvispora]|uniref:Uncharacterized protein n=1 Tax=Entomortierella parvispora TaxID=205924 RepID=A0A9P3HG23_9FUNG|nr:hypothetical protein EMPS_08345 [Entomortierella parvispora]
MLILTHLQKDDSLIPLLPYASGCLLASVLLTISGIAETHPKALALATQLIQLGWLLLQIQGAMLVWKFGTRGQATALFKVWLVSVQLLDVHRRYLVLFFATTTLNVNSAVMGHQSPRWSSLPFSTPVNMEESRRGSLARSSDDGDNLGLTTITMATFEQGNGNVSSNVLGSVRAYYKSMVCSAVPELCNLQTVLQNPSLIPGTSDKQEVFRKEYGHGQDGDITQSTVAVGMKEMEYQVVFEILAGLGVSALMVAVWLLMRALQRRTGMPLPNRMHFRQRFNLGLCSVKNEARCWRASLKDKVVQLVDRFDMRVMMTIGASQKKSTESTDDENDPTIL